MSDLPSHPPPVLGDQCTGASTSTSAATSAPSASPSTSQAPAPPAPEIDRQPVHPPGASTSNPSAPSSSSSILPTSSSSSSTANAQPPAKQGRILLVGSGPGHPSLLTLAAYHALTSLATLVLSDKLVPPAVLALIPPSTPVKIANKYPGNAEPAQNELVQLALEAAGRGETVVRLKQGDPFLYGRGGEELLAFRKGGFPPLIIPGISSALAGPLLADIPVTQRGVAESLVVCTGVGRGGRDVSLPAYERGRTTVLLMGVGRLPQLVERMLSAELGYPGILPVAIIERASSPDQRVVLSTLEGVVEAVRAAGESRAPGMICVGWACASMSGEEGELGVLDVGLGEEEREGEDRKRVERWLSGRRWRVEEGLSERWEWVADAVARAPGRGS